MAPHRIVQANHAVEHQRYLVRSDKVFVVDVQTETNEVPFGTYVTTQPIALPQTLCLAGTSFVTQLQVRLQETPDGRTTHVKVTAELKFYKSVGMMKSLILNGAKVG